MENEKKLTNSNESTLEQKDYSKEYGYLNQLKGIFNFNFYKNPTLSENNFYSTIAWYIDNLKKEDLNWEEKIKEFIKSIINLNCSNSEKLLYADKFLIKEKQKWYNKNNMDYDTKLLDQILTSIDSMYKKGAGHVLTVTGVKSFMVPERYYGRFTESGLEKKVMNKNKENFVDSIKKQREKADELTKKL